MSKNTIRIKSFKKPQFYTCEVIQVHSQVMSAKANRKFTFLFGFAYCQITT